VETHHGLGPELTEANQRHRGLLRVRPERLAAPPSSVMTSRRFSRSKCIRRPSQGLRGSIPHLVRIKSGAAAAVQDCDPADVAYGSRLCKNALLDLILAI